MRTNKLFFTIFCVLIGMHAWSQTVSCIDLNGYVESKNTGPTGYYTLKTGFEEKAAQTYYYSGPGKISQVRVYGNNPYFGGVPLRVAIYSVDANGRPTTTLATADDIFWYSDNNAGYITVSLPSGGINVSSKFAVGVTILNAWPYGNEFRLKYTGDGEGMGADLASLAGSSTGGNWSSAMDNFNKDGDFYLVPKVSNFNTADFNASSKCIAQGETVNFTNTAAFSKDSMFNKIALSNYSGNAHFYVWDFGDGSPVSYLQNPSHTYSSSSVHTVTLTTTIVGWEGTCTSVKTMQISVGLTANASVASNVSCNGGTNGSVNALAVSGASPYTYSLNAVDYQSTTTFNNLPAGNYTVSVKDALGCVRTHPFTITQPAAINFSTASSTNASCNSSDGAILAIANGGVGTITYKLNNGSFQSSGAFSGLTAGSYQITAKDGNGCLKTTNIVVNNQGAPNLNVSQTNISCNGGADGTISAGATGGTGVLLYSINGGVNYQQNGAFTGLQAGTYNVMVKDGSNCTQGQTIVLQQPTTIQFSMETFKTSCFGGSDGGINVINATGGIGNLSYSINNVSYQSSPYFGGLQAGTYTVYVRDAASCVRQLTAVVGQPTPLVVTSAIAAASCNGYGDGSLMLTANGGTAPYMYTLNGTITQPTSMFGDLNAGAYNVMVEDFNGCIGTVSAVVTQPNAVGGTAVATNSTCGNNNGGLLVTANGGSGMGYQYSLDGTTFNSTGSFTNLSAGNYYIIVKDGAGCSSVIYKTLFDSNGPSIGSFSSTNVGCHDGNDGTITINTVTGGTGTLQYSLNGINWSTSPQFTGLTATVYTVYVKDVNGCIGTTSVLLTQPSAFVITNALTNVTCHDALTGAATVFAAGGSGTLAYSIDNGMTYQSSNTFQNLPAGQQTVIVRDIAGCTGQTAFTLTQPSPITFFSGVLNVSCAGAANGAITVYAFGGTGALQYSLNGTTFQTSNYFSGLLQGNYIVYVRDANGCISSHLTHVNEPAQLTVNSQVSSVSCAGGNNGVIDLTITGGAGVNQITWSNGATTEDVFGLESGTYTVTVEDNNGCTESNTFVITEPASPLVINAVVGNTTANSGSIDATITGGTTPYTYEWSTGATSQDLSNLVPGTYYLTITDANGCISTDQFTVENAASVEENTELSLRLYPNPSNEFIIIESDGEQMTEIRIDDMQGKCVFSTNTLQEKVVIPTLDFETGMYFVRIAIGQQWIMRKLDVLH